MKTSDTTRHTIVNTGLIVSLLSLAACGLLWLSMAMGFVKQSMLYTKALRADMSAVFTFELLAALGGGLIAGLVIGGIAKVLLPKRQAA